MAETEEIAASGQEDAENPPMDIGPAEVETVLRAALASMTGDISSADLRVFQELSSLSEDIRSARQEIVALRPDEISSQYIPAATDELDAIVQATENATNAIMEAAEQIEEVAGIIGGDSGAGLTDSVTAIYEACGFQDITGQRISKIVATLQHIEQKIDMLVMSFADEIEQFRRDQPVADGAGAAPDRTEPGDETHLLNGPQQEGSGQSQAEIDALLASFD